MDLTFKIILLSMLPVSELRGAIPLGILSGMPWLSVFIISVLSNFAITPFVFLFLDNINHFFYKFRWYKSFFDKIVIRTRKKIEHRIGTKWELLALFILVAVPLPGTGAYTGVLASWLFKLNRKKSLITILFGIILAAIITTFLTMSYLFFI